MPVFTSDQGFVRGAAGLLRDKYKYIPSAGSPPDYAEVPFWKWPVPEPSDLQACTASAIAAAIELYQKTQAVNRIRPSVPFIYYIARYLQLQESDDLGASIYNGLKACFYFGFCQDSDWQLTPNLSATDKPPADAERNAKNYGVITFKHITRADPTEDFVTTCRKAISDGYPLIFGVRVDDRFLAGLFAPNFVIQTPLTAATDDPTLHNHCLLAVAYETTADGIFFWVRDSLGAARGDDGYLRIRADYLATTRECWLIDGAATLTVPDATIVQYFYERIQHWTLASNFSKQMSDAYKAAKASAATGTSTAVTSVRSLAGSGFDVDAFEKRVGALKFPPSLAARG